MATPTGLAWHRLSDTGSTGGKAGIESQPADYLVTHAGKTFFIEAKATVKHNTMQKSLVRPVQRNAIWRWAGVNGTPYYILFWSWAAGTLQLWNGLEVLSSSRGVNPERGLLAETTIDPCSYYATVDHIKTLLDSRMGDEEAWDVQSRIPTLRKFWTM